MTNQHGVAEVAISSETTVSPDATTISKKARRTKARDTKGPEDKVAVTFNFTSGFAKRLRMAVSSSPESTSEYVERNLSRQVRADLRKAMEGLLE